MSVNYDTEVITKTVKAASSQWNIWLLGTFESNPSSSAADVNINIDEVDIVKTYNSTDYMNYWVLTSMGWDYYLSSGMIVQDS